MPETEQCILGVENKTRIDNLEKIMQEMKDCVKELTNHYSRRLPGWATLLITLLSSLVTALLVLAIR